MAAVGKLDTRSKLIRTACALFNKRGYNATGISEILRTCETSIGSLYYHFPGGKEELGVEAIRYAADLIVARISRILSAHKRTIDGVCACLADSADHLDTLGSENGLLVALVALETYQSNEQIRNACRDVFDRIQALHVQHMIAEGYASEAAQEISSFILSVNEGAIMLSVNSGTGEPLRAAARQLRRMYDALPHPAD
ncbi:MAG: TetR/AcrR family transcriptional regulator [Clostridiales bacterium]|nr:TetR/AcrR family transcriptional regulator [Clostridiales bacterium]